jgi:hypothetical protein
MVPVTVIWVTVIGAPVVAVAPVRPVGAVIVSAAVSISIVRTIVRSTVAVRTGLVVTGSIKKRNWDRKSERKVDTSTRRRFSYQRQAGNNQQEDNELLHTEYWTGTATSSIKRNDLKLPGLILNLLFTCGWVNDEERLTLTEEAVRCAYYFRTKFGISRLRCNV